MAVDPLVLDLEEVARIGAVPTILRTIREVTGLRFTFVARVTSDRWVACAVHDDVSFGLGVGGELDVTTTLCSSVRDSRQTVAMDHASIDPTYCGHPTPKMYKFESYISEPIFRRSGEYFGTVCGLDPEPLVVSDEKTRNLMKLFADLISLQLDADERHEQRGAELAHEQEQAALRERFMAVLGHDVRTPLSSIAMGVDLLLRSQPAEDSKRILERLRTSTRRIDALVKDLLDLTRSRLGGGIAVDRRPVESLGLRLGHLLDELRAIHPTRRIELDDQLGAAVSIDAARIEQLVQNLLANALEHSVAPSPVVVRLKEHVGLLEITVTNEGQAIPESIMGRIFQPFVGGGDGRGLGLGLYIASQIAHSHGGTLTATQDAGHITFTLSMPAA